MALRTPVLKYNDEGAEGWIETYNNRFVFFTGNNDPRNFDIEDIAHSLSQLCRFNGHCSEFYSVAQHCCIVSEYVKEDLKLEALMHDSAEAYIGDIPRPIKGLIVEIKSLENSLQMQICANFGLPFPVNDIINLIDSRLLLDEASQLFKNPVHWKIEDVKPLGYKFTKLWDQKTAEKKFLEMFYEYWNRR